VLAPRSLLVFVSLAIGGVLLVALAYAAKSILIQLTLAVVLAMAIEPVVAAFERRGLSRGKSVGIAVAAVAIVLAGFAYLLIPPLVDELTAFVHQVPNLVQRLTEGRGRLGFLERRFHIVEHVRATIAAHSASTVVGTAEPAVSVLGRALKTGGGVVAVAFLTLFVSLGGRQWFDGIVAQLPARSQPRVRRAGSGVSNAVGGYVAGNS
jgi:predicted PurR-regulated permease PerM